MQAIKLVVNEAFEEYRKGDVIEDAGEIERILDGELERFVVKVAA